ncbi:MAG TPA: hypothetical protein PK185_07740 [Cyclobacteriaceae bacterium]|nr:hypothetical protein [Cyclobacteriaceae bacterium]
MILVFLFTLTVSTGFERLEAQDNYVFKSKKCVLSYSYLVKNDSTFMHGFLKEIKTNAPVYNMNISVDGHSIGTVPNLEGEFLLYLPQKRGTILFDKVRYDKFKMEYLIR